jgi:hypothetical protein
MELPHLLDDIPFVFRVNDWFEHDGASPHLSREVRGILDQRAYPSSSGGHFFTCITLFNGRVPPEVIGDYCDR